MATSNEFPSEAPGVAILRHYVSYGFDTENYAKELEWSGSDEHVIWFGYDEVGAKNRC